MASSQGGVRFPRKTAGAFVTALLFLPAVTATPTQAASRVEISFPAPGGGNKGNFDLDLAVDNHVSGAQAATYGTHSQTSVDTAGYFLVRNRLGKVLDANPRVVSDVVALNDNHATFDLFEGDLRWTHEVSTVAWDPITRKWHVFWHTFPKTHPAASPPYGKNKVQFGWIGMKTMSNIGGSSHPDPNLSTLSAKETRLFRGKTYDARLQPSTDAWAQATPSDPVPGNTKYTAYSEPAAYNDNGVLYVSMTGFSCPTPLTCAGDVIMVRSTDGGATWSFVGVTLAAADAARFDARYTNFTASAIYRSPSDGTLRLIVSPVGRGTLGAGTYQGILEFEFTSLVAGTVVRDATGKPVTRFEIPPEGSSVFTGAGSFHHGTGNRSLGRHQLGDTLPFRSYEWVP